MKTLTVFELEFMRKLWASGAATPEKLKQLFEIEGRIMTGGTVRKMLGILMKKGFVEREKTGRTYLYKPAVSAESAKSGLIKDILNRAYDGSLSHMFASFLDNEKVSPDDLEKIAVLIDNYRKEHER